MDQRSGVGWFSGWIKILKDSMRGFLQHWTASSTILTSKEGSFWRNKKPKRRAVSFAEHRLLAWSRSASGSLEPMILSKTTPTCSRLFFEMTIFRNSILSGTKYLLLSMTKIPHDDILEGLYKLRTRESEKLRTVLELYDLETHQKKIEPVYHRLKIMVKRSIEQDVRNWNFGIRNGNFEKKRRGQESGCSFRHDINKRGKSSPSNLPPNSFMQQDERKTSRTRSPRGKSPSGRMSRWPCKDYFEGTCNNSVGERWHPPECLFYKSKSGCRFGEKCSFAHRQVDEQLTKRSKKNDDKSAMALMKKGEMHDRTGKPVVNRDTVVFVKLTRKVSMKLKNWKDFRGSTFDTIARRRLVEDQDTILDWNLLARYRNCKMKSIVWMIQKIFKILNQHAVDIHTLPLSVFPTPSGSWC